MLFDGFFTSMLDKETDITQLARDLYPGLPCRHSFWRAQFLPREVKRGHNDYCRELYDICIEDYKEYMALFWDDFRLDENDKPTSDSKQYAAKLLAIVKAINTISDNLIRNPIEWIKWRRRRRMFNGSGKRIGKMISQNMSKVAQ